MAFQREWGSIVTAPPIPMVKRSTFSAAAGPVAANPATIESPPKNALQPRMITPPCRIPSRVDPITLN